MLAYHLALLPWSAFVSLTSGAENKTTGAWYYVPRSPGWWVKSVFGWLRDVAGQQGTHVKKIRFVMRFEKSEANDLLHAHLLIWTGSPWTISDAFKANSLWRKAGNGTRHCTPYEARLAASAYVVKGLEAGKLEGLSYELAKTGQTILEGGSLILDNNLTAALHRLQGELRLPGKLTSVQGRAARTNAKN